MHGMPHDAVFKSVLGQPENAQDALRTIVPAKVGEAIHWQALTLCSGSFVDAALASQHSDLLYSARWRTGDEALLYFLFEHQSSLPTGEPMAFRMLRYQVRIWERWLADHPKARKLPVIMPMVLYHGAAKWTESISLDDLLPLPPELELPLVAPLGRYRLLDLSEVSEDELRTRSMNAMTKMTMLLLKHARSDTDMMAVLSRSTNLLREIAKAKGIRALEVLLRYLLEVDERVTPDALQTLLEREVGPDAKESIMTAAQRLREEGRLKGREEGREEGREMGREEGREEGREVGREEGRTQASREMLLRLVQRRFGANLPTDVDRRLRSATLEQAETWSLRILTATTLADLFAE